MVQMGTQVEPHYEGHLYALLHNISDSPITLKFRDFDTRPFTIEFSYTSRLAGPPPARKKYRKTLKNFIPANHARGGMNLVIDDIHQVQDKLKAMSEEFNANKMLVFTGICLIFIVFAASLLIPFMLTKFSYDRNSFPLVNADAIAAMKYGPNHSNDAEIVKEVIQEIEARPQGTVLVSRNQYFAERITQLAARRDSIRGDTTKVAELKSINKQIDELVELLRK